MCRCCWIKKQQVAAAQWDERPGRQVGFERPDRGDRGDRFDRGDRGDRPDRGERSERFPKKERIVRAPDAGMQTFRIEVGYQHGVKPGNIVGAIANEGGIDSKNIGRIEIYDDYSVLDMPDNLGADVLSHLAGMGRGSATAHQPRWRIGCSTSQLCGQTCTEEIIRQAGT
jgi:ATP-dependent RNA helicase DeaD